MTLPSTYKSLADIDAVTTAVDTKAVVLSDSTQMTIASMRGVWDRANIYVPATGVAATDTAAIQAALDTLEELAATYKSRAVYLSGNYKINATLDSGNAAGYPVSIIGLGQAYIEWAGDTTTDYMIKFAGTTGRGRLPVLQNVMLNPIRKSRGVWFDYVPFRTLMRDVYIWQARQIGADLVNCLGCTVENTTIASGVGIAMRTYGCNSSHFNTISFQSTIGCHHSSWGSAANQTLWTYEVANGKAAAEAEYGADYVSDWPAVDDETVPFSGGYIQTAETSRAVMILSGGNCICSNLFFDNCRPCEYPLIYTTTRYTSIMGMREEQTSNRLSKIVWNGNGTNHDGMLSISQVDGASNEGSGTCRAFLELRGDTFGAKVSDSYLHPLGTSVIYAADGDHTDAVVDRVYTIGNVVAAENYLDADALASIAAPA